MKSNRLQLIASFLLFLFFSFTLLIFSVLKEAYQLDDNKLKTSKYKHYQNIRTDTLTKAVRFSFKAFDNNLGSISLHFNTHNQINKSSIIFRIKEIGEKNWYYENTYKTDQFQSHSLFPFGFPILENSRGKEYVIELLQINTGKDDFVDLDNKNYFLAVYARSPLMSKLTSLLHNSNMFMNILSVIPIILYLALLLASKKTLNFIGEVILSLKRKEGNSRSHNFNWKQIILENYLLFIFCLFFVIIRIQFLDIPRWDGGTYFASLIFSSKHFSLSFAKFLEIFRWWEHPSYGYAVYMTLFQLADPGSHILMHMGNIVLALITILSFYSIIRFYLPKNRKVALLGTGIFAFNPLYFSLSLSPNLDFAVTSFFIIALCFFLRKQYVLFFLFSLLTIFSKEIGILFLSVWLISYAIVLLIKERSHFIKSLSSPEKTSDILRSVIPPILSFLFPVFIFVLYLLFTDRAVWGGSISSAGKSIKLEQAYIITRIGEFFILNYVWYLWILIILSISRAVKMSASLSAFYVTLVIFFIFNLVYVSFPHPRYLLLGIPLIVILFTITLSTYKKHIQMILGITAFILFFMQIFHNADPISKKYFGTIQWGSRNVLKIGDDFSSRADSMVYNTQYVWIDRLYDEFLRKEIISSSSTIITNNTTQETQTLSYWLPFFSNPYQNIFIRVKNDTKQRTYSDQNSFIVPAININDAIKSPTKGEIYYLYLPWLNTSNNTDLLRLKKYYHIGKKKIVEKDGYVFWYYKLSPKI